MKEDAFYDRLREGFNDIFLTLGIDGNAEATVLSYEHFEKSRLWTQKYDLSHVPEKDRQKADAIEQEAKKIDAERLKKQEESIERTFNKQLEKIAKEVHEPIRQARTTPA